MLSFTFFRLMVQISDQMQYLSKEIKEKNYQVWSVKLSNQRWE